MRGSQSGEASHATIVSGMESSDVATPGKVSVQVANNTRRLEQVLRNAAASSHAP
jgi:hypothetical protein